MSELPPAYPLTPEPQPLRSLLLLFGFIMLGMTVGGLLIALAARIWPVLAGGVAVDLPTFMKTPAATPGGWWLLIVVQALGHVGTFLVPALLYWQLIDKRRFGQFSGQPAGGVAGWSLVILLTIAFMPANALIIELNRTLTLPRTLAPLERWMQSSEAERAALTKFMTTFRTGPQLLAALLTIGVLPAVGEEVLFRGVLQRKFIVWTGNHHAGIWLAAALFSAIHLQFYGFVPRMLLGALFGYVYVWSGNIWVPILAHFINNGFQVLLLFLYQRQLTSLDIDSTEPVSLPAALAGTLLTVGALVVFKRMNTKKGM